MAKKRKKKSPRAKEYKARKRTPTYHSWNGMIQRCSNPKHKSFQDYGGRGVTFDPRWRVFAVFLEEMGERPKGKTLDRIDTDKGYSKKNCQWADASQQNYNRRPHDSEWHEKQQERDRTAEREANEDARELEPWESDPYIPPQDPFGQPTDNFF